MPWPKNEIDHVVCCVFWFDCFVNCNITVNVFLVPETMNEHDWDFQWFFSKKLINCLILPVCVVRWVLKELSPEPDLFQSATSSELTCRTSFHEHVVVI